MDWLDVLRKVAPTVASDIIATRAITEGAIMKRIDLSGIRFSRLTAISESRTGGGKAGWLCKCDCGEEVVVATNNLTSGKTTSCGCRKIEAARQNCAANAIKPRHGMTNTPTHRSWLSMHDRCNGTSNKGAYKASQIKVCDRWAIFENFLEDMGERPEGTSIDRIDVYGGYSPENCRWATAREQQRNKRNTRYLLVDGEIVSLMDFADRLGIKKPAAHYFFSVLRAASRAGMKVEVPDAMD